MTPRQEVRRLDWIMRHVQRLSPAGRRWLIHRLLDVECAKEKP